MLNTNFNKINLNEWNRSQYFYYFTKMLPTGYSISVNIDITNTYNMIKRLGKKFFPAYLYVSSRVISEHEEFRIANLDNELGYYEVLHPSYSAFHNDDKTISSMWTEYSSDFEKFYNNYMEDQDKYANNHGIMAKPEMPPQNSCMIGMLPWIGFSSYTPVAYAPMNSFFPVIQAGKFFEKDGRKMMPLSISVHHAVADGYNVGLFLEDFQRYMNYPEGWIR
ncbi:chloramphenicol acetyltransferase [Paraclostridium sordellii]|uniref:chloramphenicol acetyltransferase n=1 Tax=Paraclostridium sordellii TaxID=1505 RepID=UPI0005DF262B|nr:chloramphenicol acetyltransferase [Paeniclostridium sordellii]CEO28103.1 chloramphenicol O-acetyltransferase [[Clostridium] sordellii] [Paeniclostridium sordellii]CEP48117.1 chloramphenicol O-acetyltransferase [[Clostridium] sordellii] [Paeniclostridium sordellii]